jgi:O-antigen ligase
MIAEPLVTDLRAAPDARRGPLAFVSRALILAAIPLAVWWVPLGIIPGAGNVTATDAVLALLWVLVAWRLLTGSAARVGTAAIALPLLAVLLGALAGIGAESSGSGINGRFEFALFMKRFGLAAILPLAAVLFRSPHMAAWTRAATLAAIGAQALFTLVPTLDVHLARPESWEPGIFGDRAIGLVTNPNDLAYTVIALAILHAAMLPVRPRVADRALLLAALAGAAICVVSSASRSGLLGAGSALVFAVLSRRIRLRTRIAVTAVVAATVAIGLSSTAVFEERVTRAYDEGSSEENVASRLDLQSIALRAALDHPLGVGYTGFEGAGARVSRNYELRGSDSLYFDTLLGAGFLGVVALLALLRTAWRHVGRASGGREIGATILKAGVVAFLVFGTAAVVPISVSSAPLFFSLVGAVAYLDPPDASDA